jgi:hypothetical protein
MFERLRQGLFGAAAKSGGRLANARVSEWAPRQGLAFSERGDGEGFSLTGTIAGKAWKIECGTPSRDFIHGEELRARAALELDGEVSVLVFNRPLKEHLEKKAYRIYTNMLQTSVDPLLTEEMRWLAMYQEVGWGSMNPAFWSRYSVLASRRDDAIVWLEPALSNLLLHWPEPAPQVTTPFMLMLLRGKVYLRMEYAPSDLPTLQHAAAVFTHACQSALNGLTADKRKLDFRV